MRAVDYNWVAQFVRVVRAGSFTAAAAEAQLPKSSLSRTVTNLEAELGVRLLHRTTRKLALTEAGQGYFDSVRGTFETVDDATAYAREHDTNPRGPVRIAVPPDFPGLAVELTRFMRQHTGIQLDVRSGAPFVDLLAEGVDIAIRVGRLEDSNLITRKLGDVEIGLMASPSYLRRRGRPKSIEELPKHDWVLFRARATHTTVSLSGPEGKHALDVNAAMISDEMAFCRTACEAGAGIALLPVTAEGNLERLLPRWNAGETPIWLVMLASKLVPRRVSLLRDHLVEHLPKHVPGAPRRPRAQHRAK